MKKIFLILVLFVLGCNEVPNPNVIESRAYCDKVEKYDILRNFPDSGIIASVQHLHSDHTVTLHLVGEHIPRETYITVKCEDLPNKKWVDEN